MVIKIFHNNIGFIYRLKEKIPKKKSFGEKLDTLLSIKQSVKVLADVPIS